MRFRRIAALAAVASAAAGIAASGAAAAPGNVFLCYSSQQVDPGLWSESPVNVSGGLGGNTSAVQLLSMGYWLPIAETTYATHTRLSNGYYLACTMPTLKAAAAAVAATPSVGETGGMIANPWFGSSDAARAEGYYPPGP